VSKLSPVVLLSLSLIAPVASAGDLIQPQPWSDETLRTYLPESEEPQVEVRFDADFTGDGLRDTAFVLRGNERRILKVLVGYNSEVDVDYDIVGEMQMDVSPLGSASLSTKKGVLIVEDLAGGTTAIQSLYRFRYDPKAKRMRLIGDDVTLYSRTNAHDSTAISTNRLTGMQLVTRSVLGEDGTYTDQPAQQRKVPTRPVWMEDAPAPEETLGFGE
jgi:hypothetical protein